MALGAPRRPVLLVQAAFLILFALFLVYASFFADWRPRSLADIKEDLDAFGVWAPLAVIIFQAIATVLLIPGFLLIVSTALFFGLDSIWISLIGQTLGTILCFLISRAVGRDPLRALFGQRMLALEKALEGRGFRYLLILRTLSILPTPFVVYAPGLVNIKLRHVVLAAIIGQIPFVIVFAFFGASLSRVTSPGDLLTAQFLLPLVLLVALVMFPIVVVGGVQRHRKKRRAIAAPPPLGEEAPQPPTPPS